jgi:synaptojanin
MFVLGFQEIVPLTAQQIVQTDPEKRLANLKFICKPSDDSSRRVWENKLLETLDRRPNKKTDYVLLRSEQVKCSLMFFHHSFNGALLQLVGTLLIVLVKAELTGVIRNVEATVRKVGASCYPLQDLICTFVRPASAVCLAIKAQWA